MELRYSKDKENENIIFRLLVGSKTSAITKWVTGSSESSTYYKAYQKNMDEDSYIGNTTLRMEFLQTKHHTTVFDNEAYVLVSKDYSNCLVRTAIVIKN